MQEQQNNLIVNKTENHRIGRIAWNKGFNQLKEFMEDINAKNRLRLAEKF